MDIIWLFGEEYIYTKFMIYREGVFVFEHAIRSALSSLKVNNNDCESVCISGSFPHTLKEKSTVV